MALAEEQIKTAFDQAEKEVTDLHSRIAQGIRESKKNGTLKVVNLLPRNLLIVLLPLESTQKTSVVL